MKKRPSLDDYTVSEQEIQRKKTWQKLKTAEKSYLRGVEVQLEQPLLALTEPNTRLNAENCGLPAIVEDKIPLSPGQTPPNYIEGSPFSHPRINEKHHRNHLHAKSFKKPFNAIVKASEEKNWRTHHTSHDKTKHLNHDPNYQQITKKDRKEAETRYLSLHSLDASLSFLVYLRDDKRLPWETIAYCLNSSPFQVEFWYQLSQAYMKNSCSSESQRLIAFTKSI